VPVRPVPQPPQSPPRLRSQVDLDGPPPTVDVAALEQRQLAPLAIGTAAPDADRFFETLLTMLPDLILVYDLVESELVWCSPALHDTFGYELAEVIGRTQEVIAELFDTEERTRLAAELEGLRDMPDGVYAWLRLRGRHRDGSVRWFSIRLTPFRRDPDDSVWQCLAVVRDVTHIVAAEDQLAHDALHDSLTGLANRTLLTDRLSAALERSRRGGDVAVLFCDLDDFKAINDAHGHGAGDQVLRIVGSRLRSVVRPSDAVGRLGGDEFVAIIEAPSDATDAARAVADRFAAALENPIVHHELALYVTTSIGIAALRDDDDVEDLLNRADAAMYRAKQRRRHAHSLTQSRAAVSVSPPEEVAEHHTDG
jgi:diguanylate cyclase (GGDEF)-like protein/PAS domain S-box-containing protein